jgi:hypothetical protein
MRLGETTSIAGFARRKAYGDSGWTQYYIFWIVMALSAAVGGRVQELICLRLGWPAENTLLGWLCGAAIIVVIWPLVQRRLNLWRVRTHFSERGQSTELAVAVDLSAEALAYSAGAVAYRAGWSAVTELFKVKGYWVLVVQGANYWVPRRFFSDPAAERAFVAEALSHMSQAAQKRSAWADAFVRSRAA